VKKGKIRWNDGGNGDEQEGTKRRVELRAAEVFDLI
jgi:hypothetical protein